MAGQPGSCRLLKT